MKSRTECASTLCKGESVDHRTVSRIQLDCFGTKLQICVLETQAVHVPCIFGDQNFANSQGILVLTFSKMYGHPAAQQIVGVTKQRSTSTGAGLSAISARDGEIGANRRTCGVVAEILGRVARGVAVHQDTGNGGVDNQKHLLRCACGGCP